MPYNFAEGFPETKKLIFPIKIQLVTGIVAA